MRAVGGQAKIWVCLVFIFLKGIAWAEWVCFVMGNGVVRWDVTSKAEIQDQLKGVGPSEEEKRLLDAALAHSLAQLQVKRRQRR